MYLRPLLCGMNNPIRSEPQYALYPYPATSAGGRLYDVLRIEWPEANLRQYIRAFSRQNLVAGKQWEPQEAKVKGRMLRAEVSEQERTVVLLGREVRTAFSVPFDHPWVLPLRVGRATVRCVPHPSGLSRWYNEPTNRQLVSMMLAELAAVSLQRQGVEPTDNEE